MQLKFLNIPYYERSAINIKLNTPNNRHSALDIEDDVPFVDELMYE